MFGGLFVLLSKYRKKRIDRNETHQAMDFTKLDQAIQRLEKKGEGVLVADEQTDGKMKYMIFGTEASCYEHYTTGSRLHAVNFSCVQGAASRLYIDWEATNKSLYTEENECKKHAKMIRKLIKTVQVMLEQMGVTRYISWVVENRTRLDPDLGKWKPSFHIYADLWFPNNYEIMPAFVKEAMVKAKLSCDWIDFSVYQPRSLLRMIGVSSKSYHILPIAEEDDFCMCLTASMSETPDVTADNMKSLDIDWAPRATIEHKQSNTDQADLRARVLHLLRESGERVTSLDRAQGPDSYYGSNTVGRNCLTFPGQTHHAGGNRCVVWLKGVQLWYRCLDPDHVERVICLGDHTE
jgi:hypothetical protein